MILVDSNIIIDFWKKPDVSARKIFEAEEIAICGIIQAELIHGARSAKELLGIIDALGGLIFLDIERDDWIDYAGYRLSPFNSSLALDFTKNFLF